LSGSSAIGARNFEREAMDIALRMAQRCVGTTAPNPPVGAVIANRETGEIIARGSTQAGGRPHAETEALRRAGPKARGAALYVTLEPCAHHGVTPPCADAIIAAGLSRVVVGTEDPDPRTKGQGIARLRAAGIEVVCGISAEPARWVTLGHILRVTARRPFVQVKIAVGGGGKIPRGADGRPAWVTSPEARAHGHLLRAEADAILVGANTVVDDDPDLTCRLPGLRDRSPVRIILAGGGDVPLGARLFQSAREVPVFLFSGAPANTAAFTAVSKMGVEVVFLPPGGGGVDLSAALSDIAGRGMTRLLVEGGPSIWRAFAEAGLVDEAVIFQASGASADEIPGVLRDFLPGAQLGLAGARRIGDERICSYRRI
jgi:diaminohydroxyphosphoribosylaminopyrimidine deaminase / 5-amino-6-(5-phosphoribosylamino)uracil reductase